VLVLNEMVIVLEKKRWDTGVSSKRNQSNDSRNDSKNPLRQWSQGGEVGAADNQRFRAGRGKGRWGSHGGTGDTEVSKYVF